MVARSVHTIAPSLLNYRIILERLRTATELTPDIAVDQSSLQDYIFPPIFAVYSPPCVVHRHIQWRPLMHDIRPFYSLNGLIDKYYSRSQQMSTDTHNSDILIISTHCIKSFIKILTKCQHIRKKYMIQTPFYRIGENCARHNILQQITLQGDDAQTISANPTAMIHFINVW